MTQGHLPPGLLPYVLAVLVLGMVIRRSARGRRIRVDQLWIVPVLLLVAAAMAVSQTPPRDPAGGLGLVLAALMGAAVGWQRGRLTRISRDPETGVLTSKATPAAVILIVALFAARYGLRLWMVQHPGRGLSLATATDALVLFGAATIAVARLEMWLRCKRLIAAGAGTAG